MIRLCTWLEPNFFWISGSLICEETLVVQGQLEEKCQTSLTERSSYLTMIFTISLLQILNLLYSQQHQWQLVNVSRKADPS